METRRLTFLAVLLATAVVLNIVERVTMQALTQPFAFILGPVVGAGGVRIGLANVVVLLILYTYGAKDSFMLLILRIGLVALLAGLTTIAFLTSLFGGLFAFSMMMLFKNLKGFSIISVSVMAAVGHVIGQVFVAVVFFQLIGIVIYIPVMLLIAIPAGVFTGKLSETLIRYLKPIMYTETL